MNFAFSLETRTPELCQPAPTRYRCRATSGDGDPPPAVYPLRARTTCSRSRARTSNALQPALADASNASMYWFRISPTICRAAMLACAGEIAMKKSPPVHRARSVKSTAQRPRAVIRIPRIVHRRHHGDDVDRDVDAAGNGRNFRRRQPALRIDAVGQDHNRRTLRNLAAACRRLGHRLCRFRDRVEERRLSERRLDLVYLRLETLEVGREVGDLLATRVSKANSAASSPFFSELKR